MVQHREIQKTKTNVAFMAHKVGGLSRIITTAASLFKVKALEGSNFI
jgi:hypothetical protein